MRCFVVAGFLLTSASRGPSAIAELLVSILTSVSCSRSAKAEFCYFYRIATTQKLHHSYESNCIKSFFTVRRLAKRGISSRHVSVCLSVCLCVCVCLSHSGIVSKRLNVGSCK